MLYYQNILKASIWGLFLFLQIACRQTENKPRITEATPPQPEDSAATETVQNNYGLQEIDTGVLLDMLVNDKPYKLKLTSDEFPSVNTEGVSTTTVRIIESNTNDTIFKATYDFNYTDGLYNPSKNSYWLGLINSGGGSGYRGTLFNIRIADTVVLQPILNFGELTHWISNRQGSAILLLDGIWNIGDPDSEDFESHFGDHIHTISVYTIQKDTVLWMDLGLTKHKYSSEVDANNLLHALKMNEPQLSGKIEWKDYE